MIVWKPSRLEFAALIAAITFVLMIPIFSIQSHYLYPGDYRTYMQAVNGADFYYPYWIKLLLAPFALLPFWVGYVLWSLLNIGCIYAACKLWGGNAVIALLSYPMLTTLFYGQITGILVWALVLFDRWIARYPFVAGWCAALAFAKPQLAIPVLLVSALRSKVTGYQYIVSALPTLILFAVSLMVYGDWVTDWIYHLPTVAHEGSITLWAILGHWALLLWLPLGFIAPEKRLLFVICTTALSLPYFQLTGLLLLLALLPLSAFSILAFAGYTMVAWGWFGAGLMVLLPLTIYIQLLLEARHDH